MTKAPSVATSMLLILAWSSVMSPAMAQLPPVPTGTAKKQSGPRLYVAQRHKDLGTIIDGEKYPVTWLLENRGNEDLIIEQTQSSCGCTVIKLDDDDKIIAPGATLEIRAEFNTKLRRGDQAKKVIVKSNDPAEPELTLEFVAKIEVLFNAKPGGVINLRLLQRGQTASQALDLYLGPGRKKMSFIDIEFPQRSPITATAKPIELRDNKGIRVQFTAVEDAPVGRIHTTPTLILEVDGIKRERELVVVGEIVGDLVWTPVKVDATRQASNRGKKLVPVRVRAQNKMPFDILSAKSADWLEVSFYPVERVKARTEYKVEMVIGQDAPSGPFGTTLWIKTSAPDQPLISIPVFGIVRQPVEVDPPVVFLTADGTQNGPRRRLKLQASPQDKLDILDSTAEIEGISISVDEASSSRYRHLRYLDVVYHGTLAPGRHETKLIVTTNIAGAQRLEIPVAIVIPL